MRDDLHKSAPVSAKWRRWMQTCGRLAEQGEVADACRDRAILRDINLEVPSALVTSLLRIAADPQTDFLAGKLQGIRSSIDVGGNGAVMAEQILSNLSRFDGANSPLTCADVEAALAQAIASRVESVDRAVCAHALTKVGDSAHDLVREMRRSLRSCNPVDLARKALEAGGPLPIVRRKRPVGLDDDLSKPAKK